MMAAAADTIVLDTLGKLAAHGHGCRNKVSHRSVA
jgi:hypothetical protein